MAELYLRTVTREDRELLFLWVNSPEVRKNSFQTADIPYERHIEWFEAMLNDDKVYQYILCQNEEPVGQIRLNVENDTAWVSYSIASAWRGQGFGSRILLLAKERAVRDIVGIARLAGRVKYENIASRKAFEHGGFQPIEKEQYLELQLQL